MSPTDHDHAPPEALYRYRGPAERDLDDLLLRSRVYLPSPAQLNDPFDCLPALRPPTLHEIETYIAHIRRVTHHVAKKALPLDIDNGIYKMSVDKGRLEEAFRQSTSRFRLLSLSSKNTDELMWAHYSQNHTGFCVRFDCKDPFRMPIGPALPVNYSAQRPLLCPLAIRFMPPQEVIAKSFLRKSLAWAYEEEWRVVFEDSGEFRLFDNRLLTDVYLGANASEDLEKKIRERIAVASWPQPPRLWRARLDPNCYGLHFEESV